MHRLSVGLGALALNLLVSTALAPAALAQNALPPFVVPGAVAVGDYDGVTDDLLTGGLGVTGLSSATAPPIADPANPTRAELRRRAIHNAYRGLVDTAAGGGWRVLFGPNLGPNYVDTGTEGRVAGREYMALTDDGSGRDFQTALVQIPANFDTSRPCLVTGPSSGSRNVFGAVGTTGEWAFRNRCAIAYTDKGTGNAYHDLTRDFVYEWAGLFQPRTATGFWTNFVAEGSVNLEGFRHSHPNRLAYKQAHSGKNVDSRWGDYTLQAIQLGFWALNDYLGNGTQRFTPANTTVIAAGVSNGGGAAIRAAEKDSQGLIDGVVTVIPNVIPPQAPAISVAYGDQFYGNAGKHFADYYTFMAIYAPCASLAPSLAGTPLQGLEPAGSAAGVPARANRCFSLKDKGLLNATDLTGQAEESLQRIHAYGYLPDGDFTVPFMEWASAYRQITDTYLAGYGRFRVDDQLCGTTFAATDTAGLPTQFPAATAAVLFAAGNIIPPAGGINAIAENATNGPIIEQRAVSRSTGRADLNLDAALCYRSLVTGQPAAAGQRLTFRDQINAQRVRQGMQEVVSSANLHGLPSLIFQARNDQVLHPNHAGRAYFGWNKLAEGAASKLSYIEVPNTQHFESLINSSFVSAGSPVYLPIHHYYLRGLDAMLAHLRDGASLPQSQIVRTVPRTAALTQANYRTFLPDVVTFPAPSEAITFNNNVVSIPK